MSTGPQDPYTPPRAELADAEPRPGSPVKAVVLGMVTDIGGTLVTSVALGIAYGISLAASGVSQEEIAEIGANLPLDSWPVIGSIVFGCAFSVLGGYVCARIVKRGEYKYGAFVAVISAMLGLLMGAGHYPELANVSLTVLTFLMVMLGARLGYAKNRAAERARQ